MKIVKNATPDDLAKEQLNKIELSQSFILAINYGGRIEVITKDGGGRSSRERQTIPPPRLTPTKRGQN